MLRGGRKDTYFPTTKVENPSGSLSWREGEGEREEGREGRASSEFPCHRMVHIHTTAPAEGKAGGTTLTLSSPLWNIIVLVPRRSANMPSSAGMLKGSAALGCPSPSPALLDTCRGFVDAADDLPSLLDRTAASSLLPGALDGSPRAPLAFGAALIIVGGRSRRARPMRRRRSRVPLSRSAMSPFPGKV